MSMAVKTHRRQKQQAKTPKRLLMRCRQNIKNSPKPSTYQTMILSARLTRNATGRALRNFGKDFTLQGISTRANTKVFIASAVRHSRSRAIFLPNPENYGVLTTSKNRKRWRRKTGFSGFQNTKKNFCKLLAQMNCELFLKRAKMRF